MTTATSSRTLAQAHIDYADVWYDDRPGVARGWVLRYSAGGQEIDEPLATRRRDAVQAARREAARYLGIRAAAVGRAA